VCDLDDQHNQFGVFNLLKDSIDPLPHTVALLAGQFDATFPSRVYGQTLNAIQYPSDIVIRNTP
jgi:hypothetical protein